MNWPLVLNSLLVSGATAVCAVSAGVCAALWTAGLENRRRALFAALAVIALVLPPFLVTNCWIDLLGEQGLWHRWLPWKIYSLGGAVWILTLLTWPISYFLVSASWRRVQSIHLEADPLLAGNALLRWLLLPLAGPALAQGAILTLVLALNNFAVPAILQVKVFPAEIWVRFNTTFDYLAALKLSWPLMAGPLLLVMLLRRSDTPWSWRADAPTARAFGRQLGRPWRLVSGTVSISLLALSLCVPLWQLAGSAKTWRQLLPALAAGQSALSHSLEFAAVSATLVIVLALLGLGRRTHRALTWRTPEVGTPRRGVRRRGIHQTPSWRTILEPLLWILFFMPGVLLGIALIWIFNRPALRFIYQSAAIVVLAYVIRYAAIGWSVVARAARTSDQSLIEAAQLEGATGWQTFRHAHWPQIYPSVAAAWYVTYLLCLWDVETLVLIVPPGGESLSLRVFNLLHYGHNPQVNALCLLLLILALLPLFLWGGILKCRMQSAK